MLTLKCGYFLLAFPHDAHMPCVCDGAPEYFHKIIAKIALPERQEEN